MLSVLLVHPFSVSSYTLRDGACRLEQVAHLRTQCDRQVESCNEEEKAILGSIEVSCA